MKLPPFYIGLLTFIMGVFLSDMIREYCVLLFVFPLYLSFSLFYPAKSLISGIIGFCAGSLFFFFTLHTQENIKTDIEEKNIASAKEKKFSGYIHSFPQHKENKTRFELLLCEDDFNEHCTKKILVQKFTKYQNSNAFPVEKLEYGDFISLHGKIETPKNSENSHFDYVRFLEKDTIFLVSQNPTILNAEHDKNLSTLDTFWKEIFHIRLLFEKAILSKLSYPENEYALGITLGDESGIPQKIIEDFNATGLRHLLALSGMNITIIILFLSTLFFFLPTAVRILCISLAIGIFVVLTGASSSVVRAAVMGGVGIIALHAGRKMNPLHILLLALFFITLYNPFLLYTDTSLQFSVLAVLGLLYIEPLLNITKSKNVFIQTLTATLSAQIAVLPLMIIFFEQVSIVSPLTNLLVIPFSTLAMIFTFGVAIPFIGWIFMPFAYFLLHTTLFVAEIFAQIPHATLITENMFSSKTGSSLFVIGYYCILLVIIIYFYKKNKK